MRRFVAATITTALIVSACSSSGNSPGASTAASSGASTGASTGASAAASAATSPSASSESSAGASGSAGASASAGAEASGSAGASGGTTGASGSAILSGWQSSPAEGNALTQTLLSFQSAHPEVKVDYQPLGGDYAAGMAGKFASGDVPDVFYVDAGYAKQWIDQGYLAPLDDYITKTNFDTSSFFEGYASIFKGTDSKTYGLPKDGNTIAMAYNSELVPTPPKTLDELITVAKGLKGKSGLKAPLCLSPGLDRGLAFIYAQGGSVVSDDGKTATIDSDASKKAVQWYMDLFKDGLGMSAADIGDDWCGTSLGKKHAAMTFEGGWLDPAMESTYPDVKYQWAVMPTGSSGSPVTISYTVSYSMGADSKNKDQGWTLLSYLTGVEGMTKWTEGGVALPARKDVPVPKGKDVLVSEATYAKPGSGFMPGYNDVQKAFQDEFTNQVQKKSFDAGPVVEKTKAAIDKALNQ
jgi:multiple sugar transport system substrate-binding protein